METKTHVLIVDDDPFFRSLLKVMLGQTGCPIAGIWEAEDSVTAVEICKTKPVDLIFCDFNLPRFRSQDGVGTIGEMRQLHPNVPVYMVTAENDEDLVRRVRAVGATGHLLKPINLRTLRKTMNPSRGYDAFIPMAIAS